ncbi:MAG: tRNA (5-methylaminomethyl-2-thiouridine)(34)-methyltransferase MnmD, partial [Cyanobacteriota bacterium]
MFQPQATGDGSHTFYSPEFRETFHSRSGAKEEALGKFVYPCRLGELASQVEEITLLDVCYGLGYNSAAALAVIRELNPHCFVRLRALELDPQVPQAALEQGLLADYPPAVARDLTALVQQGEIQTPNLEAQILWDCARQSLPRIIASGFRADAVFLDPFSPPKCPQLWTVEFIALLAQCLKPRGLLATYSCAAAVRTALSLNGLTVG